MFSGKTYEKTIVQAQLEWLVRTGKAYFVPEIGAFRSVVGSRWYLEADWVHGKGMTYEVHK